MTDYTELRKLADAAYPPGPWEVSTEDPTEVWDGRDSDCIAECDVDALMPDTIKANAAFIAAANPVRVLALLDELQDYKDGARAEAERGDELAAEVKQSLDELDNMRHFEKALIKERDALKAEVERLKASGNAWKAEVERLHKRDSGSYAECRKCGTECVVSVECHDCAND